MNIFIAAGGTGGHVYPALAIAQEIQKQKPEARIFFLGTKRGLEHKIIPPHGFELLTLPAGKLNSVPVFERLKTVFKIPLAFLKSAWLLRKFKPDLVLGVGGYASGPVLLVASLLGFRSVIWEPNAMPGLTNRWLAPWVSECLVVFDDARNHLKAKKLSVVGMPIRSAIENSGVQNHPSKDGRFRILFFGGSQGARALNTTVAEMIPNSTKEWIDSIDVIHQTGSADYERIKKLYGPELKELPVHLKEYIHNMEECYSWADVVVCRAGTGTLSEIAASRKAAVLVPFPFAADNHQQRNAEILVQAGAAQMILQEELTPQTLRNSLQELQRSPRRIEELSEKIGQFHKPQAARSIVEHLNLKGL